MSPRWYQSAPALGKKGGNVFPKMMKYLLNDVAESSDRPTVLSGIWPSGLSRSPLEQSELVKMNCLNQSTYLTAVVSGVNDLPLPRVRVSRSCIWPEWSFFFFFFFYGTSGITLRFSYRTGRRVATNLKQVMQRSGRALLDSGQVRNVLLTFC